MTIWQLFALGGLLGAVVSLLYQILQEIRSIRRMMNADRKITNEVQDFGDD